MSLSFNSHEFCALASRLTGSVWCFGPTSKVLPRNRGYARAPLDYVVRHCWARPVVSVGSPCYALLDPMDFCDSLWDNSIWRQATTNPCICTRCSRTASTRLLINNQVGAFFFVFTLRMLLLLLLLSLSLSRLETTLAWVLETFLWRRSPSRLLPWRSNALRTLLYVFWKLIRPKQCLIYSCPLNLIKCASSNSVKFLSIGTTYLLTILFLRTWLPISCLTFYILARI